MIVISENNAKKIIDLIDNRIFSLKYANVSIQYQKFEIDNLNKLKKELSCQFNDQVINEKFKESEIYE